MNERGRTRELGAPSTFDQDPGDHSGAGRPQIQAEGFLQAVTAGLMVVCFMVSLVALIENLVSGWQAGYIAPLCGLVTVEGFYSRRLLGRRSRLTRLIEVIALFLVFQIALDLVHGSPLIDGGMPHFDGGTALAFVPVLLSWMVGSGLSRMLAVLNAPRDSPVHAVDRPPPLRVLRTSFLWGGIALFAVAALSRPNVASIAHLPENGAPGPVVNVLLYFLLGTLLLAQVQYASLQQRWRVRGVTITGALGSRWLRYTLIFVALVALLALILPTSRTADALLPGRDVWNGVVDLMRGPFTWLLRLLGHTSQQPVTSPPPQITPPPYLHGPHLHQTPPPKAHHGHTGFTTAVTRVAVFWLLIVAALVYLLRTYGLRRPGRMPVPGVSRLTEFFAGLWKSLRRLLGRSRARLARHLPAGIARAAASLPITGGAFHLPRSGSVTPREQVQRYFLNILRRAQRQGLGRKGSQTPREFAAHIGKQVPEAGNEMTALTEAFLEARYSRHAVAEREVERARSSWQRVRTALRRRAGR